MKTTHKRTTLPAASLLLAVTMVWCASSAAAGIPMQGDYRFTVLRDGSEVEMEHVFMAIQGLCPWVVDANLSKHASRSREGAAALADG